MTVADLLARITADPATFGGEPIVRCRRLAVEHVLAMPEAGGDVDTIAAAHPWLVRADVLACIAYARRLVAHERIEPFAISPTKP
jgi:uncharacterized protein (DUF433 family)